MSLQTRFPQTVIATILAVLCFGILPSLALAAKPAKTSKPQHQKEGLVLMPIGVSEENQNMRSAMETAIAQGLAQKYEVFSGERVLQELRKASNKENHSAKKNCDETRCLEDVAIALQTENFAMVNVIRIEGGYLLSLSIKNVMDNKAVFDNSVPCKNCDVFQVVEKLKELSGTSLANQTEVDEAPVRTKANDPESALWSEVQKGNSIDDYTAYLSQYPKGKYLALAKSRIKKLTETADAELSQQDQSAWESANATASIASYQRYLESYPKGQFAALAQVRLNKLNTEAAQARQRQEAVAPAAQTPSAKNWRELASAEKSARQAASVSNDSTALARVNGATIPQLRVDIRIKAAMEQGQKDSPELRKAVRDDLINLEVIAQEAVRVKLGPPIEISSSFIDTPIGQQNILAQQSALTSAYVQDYVKKHPVSNEALQHEYDALKNRVGKQEYKVSHILVASENEARSIRGELRRNAKFDKLAKEKSKDPGSSNQGGDLGWTVPSNFVQPFGEAILRLSKGEISDPVETQFGWHIIKLEDSRGLKVPAFEEVRPNLEKRLQQQTVQEAIKLLRANARIE